MSDQNKNSAQSTNSAHSTKQVITALPNIKNSFAEWYHEIVFQAELADHAPVRVALLFGRMDMRYGKR